MTEKDREVLKNARKLRVQVVGEYVNGSENNSENYFDFDFGNGNVKLEEERETLYSIKVIARDEINEDEFKQLFNTEIYLTDILQNELLCYCFESEEEIELTPALKERLLKFALNNKARIVIDNEVIYDFVEKKDVKQAVAGELKKQESFEIIVWTDKVPVEYKHGDITVRVNEDGTISYSGKLRRTTNAGNDFFILDTNAPYYIIEEGDKVYLLLGQTFKDKNEFSSFVRQMLEKKWEGAKLLRKTEIKLKNAKIILCFYEYNNKRFISILSSKNSVYRSVV
jgi:uncharacterized protein YfeS